MIKFIHINQNFTYFNMLSIISITLEYCVGLILVYMIIWAEDSSQTPEDSVENKMKETYPLRRNDCTKLTIKECFLQWPHLKTLEYVR